MLGEVIDFDDPKILRAEIARLREHNTKLVAQNTCDKKLIAATQEHLQYYQEQADFIFERLLGVNNELQLIFELVMLHRQQQPVDVRSITFFCGYEPLEQDVPMQQRPLYANFFTPDTAELQSERIAQAVAKALKVGLPVTDNLRLISNN